MNERRRTKSLLFTLLLLLPAASLTAYGQDWKELASDPQGDGAAPGLHDGKGLYYYYDKAGDSLVFRVDVHPTLNPQDFGINLAVDTDMDQRTGMAWWGGNTSFTFDRLVTVWVKAVPGGYSGVVGIGDPQGVASQNYNNLYQNNIPVVYDVQNNQFTLKVKRSELDDDVAMNLIAAVGSSSYWNDDIPNQGYASINETIEENLPLLEISAEAVNFGTVEPEGTAYQTLLIRAGNDAGLQVEEVDFADPSMAASLGFTVELNRALPADLQGDDSLEIGISLDPMMPGATEVILVVKTNDPSRAVVQIPVTATVPEQVQPAVQLSRTSIDFGPVKLGASAEQTLTIAPANAAGLEITALTISGPDGVFIPVENVSLPTTLAEGEKLDLKIRFTPSTSGAVQGTILIVTNAGTNPEQTVALNGVGLDDASGVRESHAETLALVAIPNPARDHLELRWNAPERAETTVRIVDPTGETVLGIVNDEELERGEHRRFLDVSTLPAGVYIVEVIVGGVRQTTGLIRH